MVTIDPNNTIFSLISALLGKVVTSDEYDVSEPIARLGQYNTEVILRPKLKGQYYVEHSFKYNRIDISKFSPLYISRENAVNMSDLLPVINSIASFGSHVSVSYFNTTVNFTMPPMRPEDIVEKVLPSLTQTSLYLQLNPKSYLFIGAALLDTTKSAVFISFEVTVKEVTPPVFLTFEVTEKILNSAVSARASFF